MRSSGTADGDAPGLPRGHLSGASWPDYRRHVAVLAAVQAATGYDPVVADFWNERIDVFSGARHRAAGGGPARRPGPTPTSTCDELAIDGRVGDRANREPERHRRQGPEDDEALATALARGLWLMIFGDAPGDP